MTNKVLKRPHRLKYFVGHPLPDLADNEEYKVNSERDEPEDDKGDTQVNVDPDEEIERESWRRLLVLRRRRRLSLESRLRPHKSRDGFELKKEEM